MATCLYYTLKYFGHEQVALLDGGTAAWLQSGRKVKFGRSKGGRGDFSAGPGRSDIIAGLDDVKTISESGKDQLLDTREPAGYHGVAIVSRLPLKKVEKREFCGKGDCRHIAASLPGGVRVHNFYVPAGGDEPDPVKNDKFAHKLAFMDEMTDWFSELGPRSKSVVVGDLNVAPLEHDVWSHKQLLKVVSHTPVEVEKLSRVIDSHGFVDVAREIVPEPEKLFTWWSYRARDWKASNRGRRLDHIWVSPALKKAALASGRSGFTIHEDARGWERPSDHAPVTLKLAL